MRSPLLPLALAPSLVLLAAGCAARAASTGEPSAAPVAVAADAPPVAPRLPKQLQAHGDVRLDEYHGLRERDDPRVLAYLEAENEYTEAMTAHTAALQEELYQELVGRVRQTDESVPYLEDGFYYTTRVVEGQEYAVHCRKRGSLDAPEEVLLDGNALAEGHGGYFAIGRLVVSPSTNLLAYSLDTVGRRFYTVRFKDLTTGRVLADAIPDVTGDLVWANDDRTVFYTRQDPVTLRPYQVFRHVLGAGPASDELVYEESDDTFRCGLSKTRSKRFILIGCSQTLSNEYRTLDADDPEGEFQVFLPRERGHEHRLDHFGQHFYLRTNDGAENFRLVRTPVGQHGREHWEEVVPHRPDVLLQGFELFQDHLVVSERRQGLLHIRIRPWSGADEHELDFGEPAYSAWPSDNHEVATRVLRYSYSSLTTPRSTYDYDMETRTKTLLKRDEVLGGFDPADYRAERLYATAADGERVPISLVYRHDRRGAQPLPFLLTGYGSYGASSDASFSADRLSLLERGFGFAIAHVRGGQELGRRWYEDGKLLHKKNTFTDFIACAERLVAAGLTAPDRLYAQGGSAGGLLMGAVANMRPDLFDGIVAAVPFVDVVTTMLDDDIPLTTAEFDEWGDPRDPLYYEYMLSYSPYDQVRAQDYPNLLVTTGLHDSQVQYWEPAKWVARLRSLKTDSNLILFKTNMEAGHGGPSGRYRRYRETAFQYAFLLDLAGYRVRTPRRHDPAGSYRATSGRHSRTGGGFGLRGVPLPGRSDRVRDSVPGLRQSRTPRRGTSSARYNGIDRSLYDRIRPAPRSTFRSSDPPGAEDSLIPSFHSASARYRCRDLSEPAAPDLTSTGRTPRAVGSR